MSDRLKTLRESRGRVIADMRAIGEAAKAAKRDMNAEELAKHGELFDETERLRALVTAEERQVELDRELASRAAPKPDPATPPAPEKTEAEQRMSAFRRFLRGGVAALSVEEQRTLSAGIDTEGGYLKPPPEFIASLLKNLDDLMFIRQRARKFTVAAANSLGVPTLDTDLEDADWTVELATGNEGNMVFGKRELKPNPLAKRLKVSKTLIRASGAPGGVPIEDIIRDRMAYKFALTMEKAYLTGDGHNKPLGLFTASVDGIPTSRDVSTGNSTTAIGFDGLINAKYSVKAPYWKNAAWLLHRLAIKDISLIKDGSGQYIWRQSVRDGEPDTILGHPLMISENVPSTFTTGLYVGLFGDFNFYWIADALDVTVQRLIELYAETNQDGFIGRYEGDGMPVLAEAFARIKLA